MKTINQVKRNVLSAAAVLLGLTLFTTQASANVLDFVYGPSAAPGSELHALGTMTMDQNDGKATYFTNGKGRVLKVWAKRGSDKTLRVSVQRVYIPENYIADTLNDTQKAEELYHRLSQVAVQNSGSCEYAMLTAKDGREAYRYGEMVARALDDEN